MSKHINILSLVQAEALPKQTFEAFKKHHGIEVKKYELDCIRELFRLLKNNAVSDFDNFFVGYKIPLIGKEFDLLRFGNKFTVNIELKTQSTKESIQEQLVKNKYYLNFLKTDVKYYSYVKETNSIYQLSEQNELKELDAETLANDLNQQDYEDISDIDTLFNPSNYLVSPFNATEKFLNGQYFLTEHQNQIKKEILEKIKNTKSEIFILLTGNAGTGKTLLTYDIAKSLPNKGKVLIIHCGNLVIPPKISGIENWNFLRLN